MRTLLALALLVSPLAAAPVPKEITRDSPTKRLLGNWSIATLDKGDGQGSAFDGYSSLALTTTEGKLIAELDGEGQYHTEILVHDFTFEPMHLDLGECRGVFHFEYGELHWIVAQPGKARPAKANSDDAVYTIWKRSGK